MTDLQVATDSRSSGRRALSARAVAMIVMIVTSVLVSSSGLVVRSIEDANVWQINIYRSLFFVIAVLLIMALRDPGNVLKRFRQCGLIEISGGICLGVTGVVYTQALTTTTIANTMFIMSGIPFITMGIAYLFLREKLAKFTLIAMGVAASGIMLMVADTLGSGDVYGNLMAILTAIGFSIFAVLARNGRDRDMLPSLVIAGAFVLIASIGPTYEDLNIKTDDLLLCFFWGAILSGLGHWIYLLAAKFLAAAELTLFLLFEFALAPLWVWQFVGEAPSRMAAIGGIVVISAVAIRAIAELRSHRKQVEYGGYKSV